MPDNSQVRKLPKLILQPEAVTENMLFRGLERHKVRLYIDAPFIGFVKENTRPDRFSPTLAQGSGGVI